MTDDLIIGAGGGGGKGGGSARKPKEKKDNLNSTQYAKVLDLISEGEIQGLKNGLQSIYLNNTPIQNPNGTLNFEGVEVTTRNGTQAQGYIPGATVAAMRPDIDALAGKIDAIAGTATDLSKVPTTALVAELGRRASA